MVMTGGERNTGLLGLDMNVGFARAVLEGDVDGELWSSASGGEAAHHVVHSYGMSLIWGERVGDAFDEIVERLLDGSYRTRDEWLQIDPRWAQLPWTERLAQPGGMPPLRVESRLNFTFDPALFRAATSIGAPIGWSIVPAEASDFDRPGSVVPSYFWRDPAQFLARGGGWRAEKDGCRGALVFSSFRFDAELELGIETAPESRGQGLGAAVAAWMIEDLLTQGISPVWSCRAGNTASARLAEKLGFRISKRLPYYGLPTAQTGQEDSQ
ncbi:GNAT family N-acetyltransferase [Microbacterium sp. NPDC012755]|uniref:GNAT family N-acetyltransferase n=1 Tax=Microbacterium sp. NPDC012755 TaxID=3364184 RepID=UPI0036C181C4